MKYLHSIFVFLMFHSSITLARDYNILSFGALSDAKTLNTLAIQTAIDSAYRDGGGRVIVPAGQFLSGSIILKSNVELHLTKRGVILGSTDPKDYLQLNRWKALIMADGATNIKLSGKGSIDGQGAELALTIDSLFYAGKLDSVDYELKEKRPKVTVRPQIIELVNCKNVSISDINLKNAASWVQSYYMCENLEVDGIHVESDTYWNNDGIDIIDCKNVSIINSYFNASDDGICIKSYGRVKHGKPYCDSIYVANCTVRSSASAVKFGTASFGGFMNIIIEKIKIFDTFRSAIALESYGNGFLENVLVQDIRAVNTGNAIFIKLGKRWKDRPAGTLKNVTIKNVKVKVPFETPDSKYKIRGPQLPFFHNIFPSSITGIPNGPVKNVTLENIEISYPGKGNRVYANMPLSRLESVPENMDQYPEFSMFGELPAWGFYIRHVEGLTMKNVKVSIRNKDYRPAFVLDDVKNSKLESIHVSGDKKKEPIILNNTMNVEIKE